MIEVTITLDAPGVSQDEKYAFAGLSPAEYLDLQDNFLGILSGLARFARGRAGAFHRPQPGEKVHQHVVLSASAHDAVDGRVIASSVTTWNGLPDGAFRELKRLLSVQTLIKGRCR